MSTQVSLSNSYELSEFPAYRAMSKAAVSSLALAVMSLIAVLSPAMLWVPLLSLLLGIIALRRISRDSVGLSGRGLAWAGIVLSTPLALIGGTMQTVIYLTEVPDGYKRISFTDLRPDESRPEIPISQAALELNGQKVFVKGYMHPGVAGAGPVKEFVLVPDMGTCCFGGQPKLHKMIEVTMTGNNRLRYNRTKRKLAGVFKVDGKLRQAAGDITTGPYKLEAEIAE